MAAVSFKVRHQLRGGHVHVDVWSSEFGPETTHGKNGTLVFRPAEWDAFRQIFAGEVELIEADPA